MKPTVYRNAARDVPIVRDCWAGSQKDTAPNHARDVAVRGLNKHINKDKEFRVFSGEKPTEISREMFPMKWGDYVDRCQQGLFAYLETQSSDPTSEKQTNHLMDSFPPAHFACPFADTFPTSSLIKTRVYMSMMDEERENVVAWHWDGFDQSIINVVGSTKFFQVSPPIGPESRRISGWVSDVQMQAVEERASMIHLQAGDVFYLPAGWCHRVVTLGASFTINRAYLTLDMVAALASDPASPAASMDLAAPAVTDG